MTTSVVASGTVPLHQLEAVSQAVLVEPLQVPAGQLPVITVNIPVFEAKTGLMCWAAEVAPPQVPYVFPTPSMDKKLQSEIAVPKSNMSGEEMERVPEIWFALANFFVPLPVKERLLNVVEVAPRVWPPCAPKLTFPVPGLKREPLPLHTEVPWPVRFRVLDPPFSEPAVRVTSPEKVWVRELPRFKVPPDPKIMRLVPLTFPRKVAIPPVLFITVLPKVAYPEIDCVNGPENRIGVDPLVKVPELRKSPNRFS